MNGTGLKILHLLYESRGDSFGIGGVGIMAYEIYRRLKDRHDITLLCKRYPGARDGMIEGLTHRYLGAESGSFMRTLLSYARESARFVRTRGVEYDIIIEEFSPALPRFLGRFRERPVVLQIQGYTGKQYFGKYHIIQAGVLYGLERILPRSYRNVIVVSEMTRRRYHLDGGARNVVVIPNGIGPELLVQEPGESDYVLYIGRIDIHHKGLDLLLDAYADFVRTFPWIRLVIAGDGRDRERFSDALGRLPRAVREKIELKGWTEGEEKALLLKDALIVVVPSRYETQGIVALEAMACGKPVVASDIPELWYIQEAGAGIVFEAGNALSLASAVKDLASRVDRRAMGERGRTWVRELTWDRIALRYEDFLSDVVERQKR